MLKAFDRDYFVALLLLMPGFLSRQIMAYFGNPPKGGEFEIIASSLALSLFIFTVETLLQGGFRRIRRKRNIEEEDSARISSSFVGLLLIISIVSGIGAAWVDSRGFVYKSLSPTPRISRTRPWVTMWERCRPTWARVTLSDGRKYFGYMVYYSEGDENTELVLNRVYLEDKKGQRIKLSAKRLLLFGKDITSVEALPAVGVDECRDEKEF